MSDCHEYRVLLVLPATRQILVRNDCGTLRLPHLTIPKWTRPAETLTEAIEEKWHISSAVIDFFIGDADQPPCAVIEVRQAGRQCPELDPISVEADTAGISNLSDRERDTVRDILAGNCRSRGPFSRLGWVNDAQEWIKSFVNDREVDFTDQIRQLNACGTFALVRFANKRGPAYWLKAVGEPNAHEFAVTLYLAQNCPGYLAKLVCARTDWNAWVTEEKGQPLPRPIPLCQVEQAVTRWAEIQTALVSKADELSGCGCIDQRVEVLQAHIDTLIAYLARAMERQTSTKVPRLGERRLRELGEMLQTACSSMRALDIPNSLIHNDLNSGNILFDGASCVFTDWSEAYVGNPFLVFQQLCALVSRDEDTSLPWVQGLRALYKSRWCDFLTDTQMDRAFALTPLLAVLSCLYGRGSWLKSSRREDPDFQGYARSLARYMDRAARNPQLLWAL